MADAKSTPLRVYEPMPCVRKFKDVSGKRFKTWTVSHILGRWKSNTYWRCVCDCGAEADIPSQVIRGRAHGGRCKECTPHGTETHGHSRSEEYGIWKGMLRRCSNSSCSEWERYGGRGITVCNRWRESVQNFIDDMGARPSTEHSIDRKDNDGNYSCGKCDECLANGWVANCRWATQEVQCSNTRRNRFLTYEGETLTLTQWARRFGLTTERMRQIKAQGISLEPYVKGIPRKQGRPRRV